MTRYLTVLVLVVLLRLRRSMRPSQARQVTSPSQTELTPEERANYCAILVDPEPNQAIREGVLQELAGTWKRARKNTDFLGVPFGDTFQFIPDQQYAQLSGALFEPAEEIHAKRICVSAVLERTDQYTGFRLIEFLAENNEGAAVIGIKFARPQLGHDYPVLWMTERQYYRYGQNNQPRDPDAAFETNHSDEVSARIWVYPTRTK
ncbi:MAG: hypothetical protein A2428_06975 [Bdellovibrionales bacterium RIFOXYC1_FULL_54_43]|nr:MAG: hypothetical protein A2428_06975 [Bdellovibrionales bacterium RIFOXYC1_FULL_54_43]OFZ85011.1 MAG: hypothetical protein A2603_04035 [Bdellovibrionales bacterium RIFOXYD1_FULL_55_31]